MCLGEQVCTLCAKFSDTMNRRLHQMILSVCTVVQVFTGHTHIAQLMRVQPLQLNGLLTACRLANRNEKVKQTENMFLTFTQEDRSDITHLCNVSDYPTDPRKK